VKKAQSTKTGACSPHARCWRYRDCEPCARARQARFADQADRLAELVGPLWYSVLAITEHTVDALAAAKRRWLRLHRPAAALWSVEVAPESQLLHVNLLHPVRQGEDPRRGASYAEPVTTIVRAVAAYMTKPGHYPPPTLWPGPTAGTLGPLRPYLQHRDAFPLVAAASLDAELAPRVPAPPPAPPLDLDHPAPELTPEQYRALALAHLPALLAAVALAGRHAQRPRS
jgi:hypothetical protein